MKRRAPVPEDVKMVRKNGPEDFVPTPVDLIVEVGSAIAEEKGHELGPETDDRLAGAVRRRCLKCHAMLVVIAEERRYDDVGFGGSAVRMNCGEEALVRTGECAKEGHDWPAKPTRREARVEGAILPPNVWICKRCHLTNYLAEGKRPHGRITGRRENDQEQGGANMERSRMKRAALDLNKVLDLDPAIDLTSDDLEGKLRQAKALVNPKDKLAEDTRKVLDELNGGEGKRMTRTREVEPEASEPKTTSKKKATKEETTVGKKATKKAATKETKEATEGAPEGFMYLPEAAKELGISVPRCRQLVWDNSLKSTKKDGKRLLFTEKVVRDLKEKREEKRAERKATKSAA